MVSKIPASSAEKHLDANIELKVNSLSLSITHPTPFVTFIAQRLRPPSNATVEKYNQNTTQLEHGGEVTQSPSADATINYWDHNRNTRTSIFRNVDMSVKPGQVCIILGGSGSGKSTLLNSIAGRINGSGVCMTGSIEFNGSNADHYRNNGSIGYLQQNDYLMPFLTVRESFIYTAYLRLPTTMSTQTKHELVEHYLIELGLKECANTRIGNPEGKGGTGGSAPGISGGERRRVSLGIQLLTNPAMLLCDEVTSGLDAFSSFEVINSLVKLAKSTQKTIVISIHQPRSEIFKLLSDYDSQMVLLSKGDVIYSGPIRSVLTWMASIGVDACPREVNPFDYLLDLSMIDFSSNIAEKSTADRHRSVVQAWALRERGNEHFTSTSANLSPTDNDNELIEQVDDMPFNTYLTIEEKSGTNLWTQIQALTSRGWSNQIRDSLVFICIAECVLIGLVLGALYYNLDGSLGGIRSHSSLIHAVGAIQSYLVLIVQIFRFSKEIEIFDHERMDRWYGPLPYVISTCLNSAPFNVLYPIVFSSIVYYMAGLRTDSMWHFLWWLLVNIGMQFATSSFALMCTSVVRGFPLSSMFGNSVFLFFELSTGFFITTSSVPASVRWVRYLAYTHSSYNILVSNEFTDRRFDCPFVSFNGTWDPYMCAPWDGNLILKNQLNVETHYYPGTILQMLLYFIGYLFVAWFALTIKVIDPASIGKSSTLNQFMNQVATKILSLMPKDISGLRSSYSSRRITHNSNEASMNETHVEIFSNGLGRKDPVAIRVEGLSLSMPLSNFEWSVSGIRKLLQRDRTEKHMLKDVHAVFPSGEMTAILGESGAGKTSLLKTLLNRIPSGHNVAGSVYYNNSKNPSLKIINSICSYVRQDDSLLIPHITVRETLRFEADLRMDSSILKADKYAKVEEIIDLVGLRDCAEVIVGNSTAVGCSGGQRRRVSVGIQLIRDPLCLFLDEPTSGLDAFTAKALVLTLKQIATTGRTVVCTIHQPGSDIWQLFDNVVLLVSGGRTVYSGCVDKVAEYFEDVGYVPPLYTNIPDFILDTISVNQRSTISEEESRKRVEKFVDLFNANKNTISAALNSDKTLRELGHKTPKFAPFSEALPILTRRSFVNTYRQKILYFNRIGQPIALSIVVAIFFAPLGNRPEDVINRLGLLQETALGVFAGMLNNVALYPLERNIAFREISDGGYSATSFFFSYMVNEIPLEIVTSLGVTVFMLVITRLEVTIVTFFSFWIVMFGYINAGESIGMIFSAFTTNDGLSTTIMSTVIGIFALMTGIMTLNMPQWLDGLNYISVLKYGTVILTRNEFEKKEFECSSNDISLGACTFQTGESVIELLNFQNLNWSLYMGLFVVIVISYRVLAWLALEASAIRNKWYY